MNKLGLLRKINSDNRLIQILTFPIKKPIAWLVKKEYNDPFFLIALHRDLKKSDSDFVKREHITEVKFNGEFYADSRTGPWTLSDYNEVYETDLLSTPWFIYNLIEFIKTWGKVIGIGIWIFFGFIGLYTVILR